MQYKQAQPEAGVYRIDNGKNNKAVLGSTLDLAIVRNKLAFAKSTNMSCVLGQRLSKDIQQYGMDAFSLEILEVQDIDPGMSTQEIQRDLATLEELWREKLDLEDR